jgi:deoxycytidylate deaminase
MNQNLIKLENCSGKIQSLIQLAGKVAEQSSHAQFKHGAVLVRGGNVINVASNDSRFCSFAERFNSNKNKYGTLHAELRVILGIDKCVTQGAMIVVVRLDNNNENDYMMSKPCSMCQKVMQFVGIKKVAFSAGDGFVCQIRLIK